ncbi:transposase [Rhodococcus sp. TAF43]|uniref:transposase n=1 Tax=Rhodococcus sp. TAF43 TaxID=3237483 RepID=UPI003F97C15A
MPSCGSCSQAGWSASSTRSRRPATQGIQSGHRHECDAQEHRPRHHRRTPATPVPDRRDHQPDQARTRRQRNPTTEDSRRRHGARGSDSRPHGDPTWFPSESAFANYTGTAPVEIDSADKQRHRRSRSGDRMLNSAIHIVAVAQARTPISDGYAYHQRKMAEGKTSREAMRCLKRQVAKRLWRTMRDDAVVSGPTIDAVDGASA